MGDEKRTVEFKFKTTADNAGGEAVNKQAGELKKRFDDLAKKLNEVSKDGATVKTKAILPLAMALEALKKEAEEAGIAVEGLDKAAVSLEKAGINAVKTSEAMEDLTKKFGDQSAKAGGLGDLWDKGGTKMERFRNGAGMLAGALGTGLAIGTGIAKKAGVDFTETLSTMSEWAAKAAVAINTGITKSMEWLAGVLVKVAKFFKMDAAAQFLEDIKSGLDGIAVADANRAKNMAAAEEAQKRNLALLEKEKELRGKALQERVQQAENEVSLNGKTYKDLMRLRGAKMDLARFEKKSKAEIRAIEIETNQAVAASQKEAIDSLVKDAEARTAKEKAEADKRLAIEVATAAKAKAIGQEFFSAQTAAVDAELAHLQATGKLEIKHFVALTQKKIDLAWAASDAGIAAAQAKANAEKALADATLAMEDAAAHAKADAAVGGINAGLGAAAAAFPENKEIQVGQTVMATYEASTNAYKSAAAIPYVGFILGPVAAALALVAGFKNVQQITSTPEPKASVSSPSFDDPMNDALAKIAGRKSAIDVVNHTTQGFREQLASGQSQRMDGNTTQATFPGGGGGGGRQGDTFNVRGSGPTEQVLRKLSRGLRKYDQKIEVNVQGKRGKRVF